MCDRQVVRGMVRGDVGELGVHQRAAAQLQKAMVSAMRSTLIKL